MITVSLHNDDQGDLFVSVADLNQAGAPAIVENLRLNVDQRVPLSVQEDGNGSANLTWSAQRTDDATKTAERTVTPADGDTVDVTTFFG